MNSPRTAVSLALSKFGCRTGPILRGLALLLARIEYDHGERALKSLLVEKRSGAAKIEAFLRCHVACLANRRASRKQVFGAIPGLELILA